MRLSASASASAPLAAVSLTSRPLLALYGISLLSGVALGIFNPLISLLLQQHQVTDLLIGANASLYYLVVALCSPLAGTLVNRVGVRRVMVGGILLTALSAMLFQQTGQLSHWFVLRLLMGIGICLYMVAGQTALNLAAAGHNRGVAVAIHGAVFGVGFMLSPLAGTLLYALSPQYAFLLGSGVISAGLCAVPFLTQNATTPRLLSLRPVLQKIRIPLLAAFIYGALEGILVTLLPVYLVQQAVPVAYSAWPLPLFMLASGIGMIPLARCADQYGQTPVFIISALMGLLTCALIFSIDSAYAVPAGAVLLGLSVGTFFPLALALVGHLLDQPALATGSALFTASFSYGCAAGPVIATLFVAAFGAGHLFSFISVLLVAFLVLLFFNPPQVAVQPNHR